MDRRVFLRRAGTVLAATALPGVAAFSEEAPAVGRAALPINRGWRFHPSKIAGAEAPEFEDSAFERVGGAAHEHTASLA